MALPVVFGRARGSRGQSSIFGGQKKTISFAWKINTNIKEDLIYGKTGNKNFEL
jgi:hypothetical protein